MFENPAQVKFFDPEEKQTLYGIGLDDEIICSCCGGGQPHGRVHSHKGRVDYWLCDDIPKGLHLKHQPKNDGNYDNQPCIKCVAEYFMSGPQEAGEEQK